MSLKHKCIILTQSISENKKVLDFFYGSEIIAGCPSPWYPDLYSAFRALKIDYLNKPNDFDIKSIEARIIIKDGVTNYILTQDEVNEKLIQEGREDLLDWLLNQGKI